MNVAIYITGISGVGKSTVRKELVKLGYEAHDTDKDGLSDWRNRTTKEPAERPAKLEDRNHAWYAENDWILSVERTEELATREKDKLIFLCGSVGNDQEVWHLFDKVVCLVTDNDTLKARIAERSDSSFGKSPDELEGILEWNLTHESRNRERGAMIVNASQSVDKVVEDVIKASQ